MLGSITWVFSRIGTRNVTVLCWKLELWLELGPGTRMRVLMWTCYHRHVIQNLGNPGNPSLDARKVVHWTRLVRWIFLDQKGGLMAQPTEFLFSVLPSTTISVQNCPIFHSFVQILIYSRYVTRLSQSLLWRKITFIEDIESRIRNFCRRAPITLYQSAQVMTACFF